VDAQDTDDDNHAAVDVMRSSGIAKRPDNPYNVVGCFFSEEKQTFQLLIRSGKLTQISVSYTKVYAEPTNDCLHSFIRDQLFQN
jgi:hypothetical protein